MNFQPFQLEEYQSLHEHTVQYNLADSSVKGITLREFLAEYPEGLERLLDINLHYPQVNGFQSLRERIASLYHNATAEQVLVTVGASEANQLICQTLLQLGDEVVVMEPGYRQVWGMAKNMGCTVKTFQLRQDSDWRPDLEELEHNVTSKTKLIAVVNPNNPVGTVLTTAEMQRIVAIASKVGAWLLADEVYRGAERYTDEETLSFWGHYDRMVCVGSMSKAYALSGTRIGWLVASKDFTEACWRRHEYAVIAASSPSMVIAEMALEEPRRSHLINRQRQLLRGGWEVMTPWLETNKDIVSVGASSATALGFVKYKANLSSLEVAEKIRQQGNVLVAPGEFLGGQGHLRITNGYPKDYVQEALTRIAGVLENLS